MSAPGLGEAVDDLLDQLGPGQAQKVVVALLVLGEVELAAIIGLGQPRALDQRPERAVLDQDALRRRRAKVGRGAHAVALTPSRWQIA